MHTGLYVIMGVSGAGKTTIGTQLARALDVPFVDGDDLHPPENVRRMAAGIPLTDEDRRPWLLAIAARLREAKRAGVGLVASCSALKRSYRDVLRSGATDAQFIYLKGTHALIAKRMTERPEHFMPASLLDSQFATLEEPTPEEHAWVCDVRQPPDAIVANIVKRAIA